MHCMISCINLDKLCKPVSSSPIKTVCIPVYFTESFKQLYFEIVTKSFEIEIKLK